MQRWPPTTGRARSKKSPLASVWTDLASQYRLRLIAADMIHSTGRGFVDFSLPYLRDYLREHAAAADL